MQQHTSQTADRANEVVKAAFSPTSSSGTSPYLSSCQDLRNLLRGDTLGFRDFCPIYLVIYLGFFCSSLQLEKHKNLVLLE